jgi:hypothetical protein
MKHKPQQGEGKGWKVNCKMNEKHNGPVSSVDLVPRHPRLRHTKHVAHMRG